MCLRLSETFFWLNRVSHRRLNTMTFLILYYTARSGLIWYVNLTQLLILLVNRDQKRSTLIPTYCWKKVLIMSLFSLYILFSTRILRFLKLTIRSIRSLPKRFLWAQPLLRSSSRVTPFCKKIRRKISHRRIISYFLGHSLASVKSLLAIQSFKQNKKYLPFWISWVHCALHAILGWLRVIVFVTKDRISLVLLIRHLLKYLRSMRVMSTPF